LILRTGKRGKGWGFLRRINTILIFFLCFFVVLAGASWSFLQSRAFGRLLSKAITKVSSDFDAKVKFSRLDVRFFPPGLALEDVSVDYDREGTKVKAEAGELGVSFDIQMFRGKKFRLREIFLKEGFADIVLADEKESGRHPWDIIQSELTKLPIDVGALTIENSRVTILDLTLDVHALRISPSPKVIGFDGEIKQLKHASLTKSLDLLKFKGALTKKEIQADSFQILQKRSKISGKGSLQSWNDFKVASAKGDVETEVYAPDIHEWVDLNPINFYDGIIRLKGKVTWNKAQGPRATASIVAQGLRSNVLTAEELKGELVSDERSIDVTSLTLKNNAEKLQLLSPTVVWNQSKRTILPDGVKARLENLELNNALTILGEPLRPLKGEMTGDLTFNMRGNDLFFRPADGFKIANLRLEFPKEDGTSSKIIHAPVIWLSKSDFNLVDNTLELNARLKGPRTQLDIEGFLNKKEVHFDIAPGTILLTDLGNVANLDLKGEGENKLKVRGTLEDVKITIEGIFRDFEILGYRLGQTEHKIEVGLKDGVVELPFFKAKKSRYEYSGTGLVNYKNFLMDLSIQLPLISFADFRDAIHPLSDGLSFLSPDFEATLQGDVDIFARGDIAHLKVDSDVHAQKITAYGESFKDSKFSFKYADRKIQLKNFSAVKEDGKITGTIGYSLPDSRLDYQLSLRQLGSNELAMYKRLPFALDFKAVGEFQGSQSPGRWRHRGFLGLSQSRVHDKTVPDSTFEWDVRNDSVSIDAKVAKDWIVLSTTSVNDRGSTKITSDLAVDIPDLPLFLRGVLGENPQLVNASGDLSLVSKISLTDWQWNRVEAETWLKGIRLITNEIGLQQRFPAPQVKIRDGKIEQWNIKLDAPDFKITSKADGDLRNNLIVQNNLDLDAKYFELLSKHVQRAEGRATAEFKWILSPKDVNFEFTSTARDMAVSTDLLPFALSNLNYKMSFKDSELDVQQFAFRPETGKVQASGTIFFNDLEPDVNLRYSLERAAIPIKNRSTVTVTGEGLVFGNGRPYTLNGDLTINRGSILNEITDFMGPGSATADVKYLPRDREGAFSDYLNLDIGLNTENPINVTNSMMDLYLLGDLQVTGDAMRPSADGKVLAAGTQSKVFFKNSEYSITKAEFLFNGRKSITKPDFDISASSIIANYKVTAKAFGSPDSFTFDLSSDPGLSKQNILSLIAFGYTDDLSNSISPEERQNLTNVGVGSFIFDQFKVTDIVKKQFGLQVNLGTVFVQSDQSMLQGRSQDQGGGAGALARTRTATNIEVKKRLSEAMSLSVSSTVGGSIGQRQRMNLNYGLTRKIQVEGVYELRTNAEGTEDIIDNSIGGDIKYRHTFR
jgi:translocation and assembly module TamB